MTNEEKQSINNLKKYIEEDFAYREPLKNYSDFDMFCYNHCKDIETVLNIIEELKKYEQYYKEQNEVNAKFVPKSKIQERIYELENITLLTVAQRNEISYAIGVLKELLEEE